MSDAFHKGTVNYTGTYWDNGGEERLATDMPLRYVDEEREDRSAGILGNIVVAVPPEKFDGEDEDDLIVVDMGDWMIAACEQTGGHNWTDWMWDDERPESAVRLCHRCLKEETP